MQWSNRSLLLSIGEVGHILFSGIAIASFVILISCCFVSRVDRRYDELESRMSRLEQHSSDLTTKVSKLALAIGYTDHGATPASKDHIEKSLQEIEADIRRIDSLQRKMAKGLGYDGPEYFK